MIMKNIKLEIGEIKQEAIADLTIFNSDIEFIYTEKSIISKSKNIP